MKFYIRLQEKAVAEKVADALASHFNMKFEAREEVDVAPQFISPMYDIYGESASTTLKYEILTFVSGFIAGRRSY